MKTFTIATVDPPTDIFTRDPGPGEKWYKIQIYTQRPGRFGGTNGRIRLFIHGDRSNIPDSNPVGLLLDSPGDSHEQGDYDMYYTRNSDIGNVVDEDVLEVISGDSDDDWSFRIKLFELSNNRWVLVKNWADDHDYHSDSYWPSPVAPDGGVHIDRNGTKLYRNQNSSHVSKTYPNGARIFEIS